MPFTEPEAPATAGEHDDEHQAGDQRPLGADPAGHPVGDQHRHGGDHQVAGEQQRDLAGRGVQLVGDRRQDRVDQADAHERDDAGERDREHGLRLLERARGVRRGGWGGRPPGLAGLAAEPVWAALNLVVLPGAGVRAGESVKRGQRRGERGAVLGAELGEDDGELLGAPGAAAAERGPAVVGDGHLDHPAVHRVRLPAHQAVVLEPADQLRHRRLGDAREGRELREPPGAAPFQRGQCPDRGHGQAARLAQRAKQPDHPLKPARERGRQIGLSHGTVNRVRDFHKFFISHAYGSCLLRYDRTWLSGDEGASP